MNETLLDVIARHIAENYTFINSDGEFYTDDGYNKADYFIQDVILPQVDKYIEEYYEVKEDQQ